MTAFALYVHVPFCAARCGYCDYPVLVGAPEQAAGFVAAALAEARALAQALAGRPLAAVYVGGGTPTWLPRPALRALLHGLAGIVTTRAAGTGAGHTAAAPVEWTLEANPEDLDRELLEICAGAGVNRLSLGVQSFEDAVLLRLGRRCHGPDLDARLDLVLSRWTGRLNLDLLVGVPGQAGPAVAAAVDRAAALGIGHVTLLQLTDPGPGGPQPAADADQLWLTGYERLRAHGFRQYEVTHFGLAGDRSRYVCHTLQLVPLAAVGPGAVGLLPEAAAALYPAAAPGRTLQPQRVTHPPALAPYVAAAGRGWGGCAASGTARRPAHGPLGARAAAGRRRARKRRRTAGSRRHRPSCSPHRGGSGSGAVWRTRPGAGWRSLPTACSRPTASPRRRWPPSRRQPAVRYRAAAWPDAAPGAPASAPKPSSGAPLLAHPVRPLTLVVGPPPDQRASGASYWTGATAGSSCRSACRSIFPNVSSTCSNLISTI